MDFIKRKVFLTKDLRPYDTNGDGVLNALVLSATTKIIQIPIRHSYDDMGIFEVSDGVGFEVIDIGSVFDEDIKDIVQPIGDIQLTGNTWDGGGSVGNGGSNDESVTYCGDLTAINGTTLTYLSGDVVLTPNNSGPTTYQSPVPTFVINNSLCVYDDPNVGISDGNGEGGNVSDMLCVLSCEGEFGCDTGLFGEFCSPSWLIPSTWSDYTTTATSKALDKCVGLGFTRLLDNSDFNFGTTIIPQGDPVYNVSQPFAGVMLKNDDSVNCIPTLDSDGEVGSNTGYRYEFCFYCGK